MALLFGSITARPQYSSLDQITSPTLVTEIAWRRRKSMRACCRARRSHLNNFRSTPIMAGGVLYASNGVGLAEAFDPETATRCGAENGHDGTGTDAIAAARIEASAYWGEGQRRAHHHISQSLTFTRSIRKPVKPIATFGKDGLSSILRRVGPRSTGYRLGVGAPDRARR